MKKVKKLTALIIAMATFFSANIISVSAADDGNQEVTAYQSEAKSDDQIEIFESTPSKNGVEDFIADYGEKTGVEKDDCYNITPSEISEKYGFNIFKFRQSCMSVLLYKDRTYELGECFGGLGALSFAVADLNSDGFKELYFAYSWGSGIHRSEIGYFDTKNEEFRSSFNFSYPSEDMMLTNDNGVLTACRVEYKTEECCLQSDSDTVLTPAQKIVEIVFDGNEITYRKLSDEIYEVKNDPDPLISFSGSVRGDANSDGAFNATDIMTFQKWLLGDSDVEIKNLKDADLSGDGILNVLDFCLMKQELII